MVVRIASRLANGLRDAGRAAPRLFRVALWGLSDQALVSGGNFFTNLLVARAVSPEEFGRYALVMAALYLTNNLQAGLITRPHNVLAAALTGERYRRYTASAATQQVLFSGGLALIAGLAALVAWSSAPEFVPLLIALVPAAIAWQLHEFVRRVFYTERRSAAAFWNDLVAYGGQAAGVIVLAVQGALTGPSALYVIALSAAVALAVGLVQLRGTLLPRFDTSMFQENWNFGKWLAGGEAAHWLSSSVYLYFAAAILGPAGAGTLRAAELIMGPLRIVHQFLYSVLPVSFSRAVAEHGRGLLHARAVSAFRLTAPLLLAYCLAVALFARPILELAYGDKYAHATLVLALIALHYFLICLVPIVSSLLQAERLARHVFLARLYPTLVALPFGWALVTLIGVEGAVLGMIITTVAINAYSLIAYRRHVKASEAPG